MLRKELIEKLQDKCGNMTTTKLRNFYEFVDVMDDEMFDGAMQNITKKEEELTVKEAEVKELIKRSEELLDEIHEKTTGADFANVGLSEEHAEILRFVNCIANIFDFHKCAKEDKLHMYNLARILLLMNGEKEEKDELHEE